MHTKLTQIYREMDRDLAELYYRLHGDNFEVTLPFVADDACLQSFHEEWENLKQRVESLEAPDRVYQLLKQHFTDFLATLCSIMEAARRHPEELLQNFPQGLVNIARLGGESEQLRCQKIEKLIKDTLEAEERYLNLIRQRHEEADCRRIGSALIDAAYSCRDTASCLTEHFHELTDAQLSYMKEWFEAYADFLSRLGNALAGESLAEAEVASSDDLSITVKMNPEEYRSILRDRLGVDLDDMLSWYREDMEKTRRECYAIAADLHLPDADITNMIGINDILFRYEPPCSSGEEMHARCNAYLERTRALAHEYVDFSEDERCVCLPIPRLFKDGYPWGGYEGGMFCRGQYVGQMFLNQYNYSNITDGWIKLNALHEAYPGHHVQFVCAAKDPMPETVKIGSRMIPILEGTCLRTERTFQDIFAEDPVFPLFVAYRRHHGSVRIYVDLMMFYYGATLEEVVEIYERELGFDRVTARAQVRAHQNAPGYFTSYYYGMRKIAQWEEELGYDKKTYTNLLFAAGFISMESLNMLVHMNSEEQYRYLHDFPTMLREKDMLLPNCANV